MKKRNLTFLFLALLLLFPGCKTAPKEALPDYSFTFRWGVHGISSYESESGLLIKTTDATDPSRYRTTHVLTAAEREEIGALLSSLDLRSYPAEYDPFNAPDAEVKRMTSPDQTIVLSVTTPDFSRTVTCQNVCLGASPESGYDEAARRFLSVCARLKEILTSTEEWKSLPDYEFFYD